MKPFISNRKISFRERALQYIWIGFCLCFFDYLKGQFRVENALVVAVLISLVIGAFYLEHEGWLDRWTRK